MIGAGSAWLAIFPFIAFAVALYFAIQLARRYASRRREFEGVWAIALIMYAVASLAMFAGVIDTWSPAEFRAYWLLGAVLNVPFLFLGEVYLLAKRRSVAHGLFAVLLLGSVFAAYRILTAPLNELRLNDALPLGKEVFGDNSIPYRLAQFYSFTAYFLLLGGLMWSALSMGRRPDLRSRTAGVLLIAAGATIVAIGSGIGAGFRLVALFSFSLAAGVAVMYWGFVKTTARGAHRDPVVALEPPTGGEVPTSP
ncbi:MAG TPA: hypothetical protein VHI54_00760 [Actinomycetota bacterium]|nr:hypothetical protein [Actinomycetota bacterium]